MLRLENITKTYNKSKKNEVIALKNINLILDKGEMLAITGVSGSGKSTLMHIIGCVLDFDLGKYTIDEHSIGSFSEKELSKIRNKKIGTVFQNYLLLQNTSVIDNVAVPLMIANISRKQRNKMCVEALEKVGMESYAHHMVSDLSGGQKQRVAIARAIVNNPDYIIADEPTGSLDSSNSKKVYELLLEISRMNKGIIIATHDIVLAKKCDRNIELFDGQII